MGIDIQASIVVGLPFNEVEDAMGREALCALLEDGTLESVAPYYDADYYDCLVGFSVLTSPRGGHVIYDLLDPFGKSRKFLELTGLPCRTYLTANVW